MFEDVFEARDKKVSDLVKLGVSLGRSLRENVSLFSINDLLNEVAYLTESGNIIQGNYDLTKTPKLSNIKVETCDSFLDSNKFDSLVDKRIHKFISNIYTNSLNEARTSFSDLLDIWNIRFKLEDKKETLEEEKLKFDSTLSIVETDEFSKLLEVTDKLVEFLSKNKKSFSKLSDLNNAVRLSHTISEAFNFPRLNLEDLHNSDYEMKDEITSTVYDMVAKQELVTKELLEAKTSFSDVWATSEKVRNLAGSIYNDREEIDLALAQAIAEVPYLALVSKKQLTETVSNALGLNEGLDVDPKDINKFASLLFEMKKPVKSELLNLLASKYGVNVSNLKSIPSFKSLANTQVVIFEALSRLSPAKSVLRNLLSEFSNLLKDKSGVEVLDVNDYLQAVFESAGYEDILTEAGDMSRYMDFSKMADDLGGIMDILRMIKGVANQGLQTAMKANQGGSMGDPAMAGMQQPGMEMSDDASGGEDPNSTLGPEGVEGGMMDPGAKEDPMANEPGSDDDMSGPPAMSPDQMQQSPMGGDEMGMGEQDPGMEDPSMDQEPGGMDMSMMQEPAEQMSRSQLLSTMKTLETLLADLGMELGSGDAAGLDPQSAEDGMPPNMGDMDNMDQEDMEGEEEEVGFPESDGGEESFSHDEEPEEEEGEEEESEEEASKSKKKGFGKK